MLRLLHLATISPLHQAGRQIGSHLPIHHLSLPSQGPPLLCVYVCVCLGVGSYVHSVLSIEVGLAIGLIIAAIYLKVVHSERATMTDLVTRTTICTKRSACTQQSGLVKMWIVKLVYTHGQAQLFCELS